MCSVTVEPKCGDLDEREEREITIYFTAHRPVSTWSYSESKYSVESVSGKYLENGWSYQHGDFSVEFIIEKLTILFFCT